jgi:adenylyltransferase/sulfurtransferase
VRSGQAAALLEHGGFAQVYNLLGGVERWAVDVDPRMPRY